MTRKSLRRKRGEASAVDESRRAVNPLCMFNNIACDGAVSVYRHTGQSFGAEFETTSALCESHANLTLPARHRQPKPVPAMQLAMNFSTAEEEVARHGEIATSSSGVEVAPASPDSPR